MDRPAPKVEIREFTGVSLDDDPHDVGEGSARESVNFETKERGTLRTRKGYRKVRFVT